MREESVHCVFVAGDENISRRVKEEEEEEEYRK